MSIESYISGLSLSNDAAPIGRITLKGAPGESPPKPQLPANLNAAVDVGSLLSFVSGVGASEKADILFSVQLAQRAADAAFDRFAETEKWYKKYNEVLAAVGWTPEQFAFVAHNQKEGDLAMDKAALAVISAIATGNQLQAITASISALEKLADGDGAITLFNYHAAEGLSGNFQIGAVQKGANDTLSMALGAFYFLSRAQRGKFLFFRWGLNEVSFWTAAQKMTFNMEVYEKIRGAVEKKLGEQSLDYIARLDVAL